MCDERFRPAWSQRMPINNTDLKSHYKNAYNFYIAGSNPTGGMNACLLWVLCVACQVEADHPSRRVLPSEVCLSVIVKPRQWGGPGTLGAVVPWKKLLPVKCKKSLSLKIKLNLILPTFSSYITPRPKRYPHLLIAWIVNIRTSVWMT